MNVKGRVRGAGRGARIAPHSSLLTPHSSLALAALVLLAGICPPAFAAEPGRVPKPAIIVERTGECVADTDTMRREHMNLLKHQRDKTMRQGLRTTQYSLNGCIECHASSKNNSVVGAKDNFCQSCHAYVGVELDCFECHAAKPGATGSGIPATLRRPTSATQPGNSAP